MAGTRTLSGAGPRGSLVRSLVVGLAAGLAMGPGAVAGRAEPSQPASPQPSLPQPIASGVPLASPIIGGGQAKSGQATSGRTRSGRATRPLAAHHHRIATHRRYAGEPLERPALAGVELVTPIPHPIQPPHTTVPVPAYPFENFITYYTTPPPPVFCHRAPRDPDAPDPHLVRERPVLCEADNP